LNSSIFLLNILPVFTFGREAASFSTASCSAFIAAALVTSASAILACSAAFFASMIFW